MKKIILLLAIFNFLNLSAQKKFEKGYFIDAENNKIECLIKNYDWMGTPTEIEYKISEDSPTEKINFDAINSFQIYNTSQYYIKSKINIDKDKGVSGFKPKDEIAILRVMVEGEATLYSYSDVFFYSLNEGKIKQLVYKKYVYQNSQIKEDDLFRTELYENLNCENNIVEIRKLDYKKNELIKFFKNYNKCKSSDFKDFNDAGTKQYINFNLIAGVAFSKANLSSTLRIGGSPSGGGGSSSVNQSIETDKYTANVILGFEAEALLPFYRNKWSVFIAPNYQQKKYEMSRKLNSVSNTNIISNTKYSSINIPIGIRHYFNLNQKSKLYLEGAFSLELITNAEESITYPNFDSMSLPEASKIATGTRFGFGYNFDKKYALSLNYHPMMKFSNSEINAFSVLASYKLF